MTTCSNPLSFRGVVGQLRGKDGLQGRRYLGLHMGGRHPTSSTEAYSARVIYGRYSLYIFAGFQQMAIKLDNKGACSCLSNRNITVISCSKSRNSKVEGGSFVTDERRHWTGRSKGVGVPQSHDPLT